MKLIRPILWSFLIPFVAGLTSLSAQSTWGVQKLMHVGGEGSWDYVTVDPATQRLFVPRSTHTMILDANSGKVLGEIPGQKTAHGVALVPSLNRGFITDGGGDGAIIVFDLKTYAVLGKLAALPDADGIIYDATQNLILVVSGDKGVLLTFKPDIDPVNGKLDQPIELGGAPEFLASDGNGTVFINLEDKGAVAKVDLKQRKVVARWPVAPGGQPVGMSFDQKSHHLFIGCRKPQLMIVMNSDNGKVVASLPIGAGVDATKFDNGHAFASCRDNALVVVGEKDGKFVVEQQVKTPAAARTMDIDPSSHIIYLPTAEFEDVPAGSKARPKQKPDSFMIVKVGTTR
jgi:DNA-binding beta-propeller fold protein YncE